MKGKVATNSPLTATPPVCWSGKFMLVQQIQEGAPADLFFSADEAKMDTLEKAGLLASGSREDLLGNTLVIVVPADSDPRITATSDLTKPEVKRITVEIAFTWRAVVLATAVMSFPLFVRTATVAFEEVDPRLEQIARTLGKSRAQVFCSIMVPWSARGLTPGTVLAFARALGEFGATVMVAGNTRARPQHCPCRLITSSNLERTTSLSAPGRISSDRFRALWLSELWLTRRPKK